MPMGTELKVKDGQHAPLDAITRVSAIKVSRSEVPPPCSRAKVLGAIHTPSILQKGSVGRMVRGWSVIGRG